MRTLKQKTINGMFWSVGERLSEQIALMITSIILARLLQPSDFGLLGMLSIFTAVAQSVIDSGFGTALIQKKDADQTDASSIFYFNLILGFILAGSMFFAAPLIARFFDQTILIPITRVISFNLIITSFSLVQISLLTKEMRFRTQMKVGLISVILSGVLGIFMAYFGMGVWSLVVQALSRYLIRGILLWFFSSWRPSPIFSFNSLASMFSYGSRLLLSGLLDTSFNNIYQTIIGKLFSVTNLGYYAKAQTLQTAATRATSTSLGSVTFAALAPYQDNDKVLKDSYKKTIRLSLYLHFPIMIGLIAIAGPLIPFLLTEKWVPAIKYFQLLCIVGLLTPLIYFNQNIMKIKGRTDLFFRTNLISKLIILVTILITYRWGILALLFGQIFSTFVTYLIISHFSNELIGYSQLEQVKDFLPLLFKSIIMGAMIFLSGLIIPDNKIFDLFIRTTTGILVYTIISLLSNSEEFYEILDIIKNILQSIASAIKQKFS